MDACRYPADFELPLRIRRPRDERPGESTASVPRTSIPAQLVEQLRELITGGTLRPGDPLPSTRALAARLGISRGSVSAAYDQLNAEGLTAADTGGTRVDPRLPARPLPAAPVALAVPTSPCRTEHPPIRSARSAESSAAPSAALPVVPGGRSGRYSEPGAYDVDLRPGAPDTTLLPTTAWRAAWRRAAAEPSSGHPPAGKPELREELADYLRTSRSVPADPANLLVTAGARDGLRTLLTTASTLRGRSLTVAVEDPGYPSLHRVPQALGHQVIPVPVDEHGLDPERLTQQEPPDLVLITPSHQYPLGASMPAARRVELIRWAVRHEALIIEDDYDSELRYVGDPLPALAALDTPELGSDGRVVTLGSFAKTLTPGLGLGFLLVPARLRDAVQATRDDVGAPVSGVLQDAMAAYFGEDGLRRHTARMRREYRTRRALLTELLSPEHLPAGVRVLPMDGGLHAVLVLPDAAAEQCVQTEAARRGVRVAGLGEYWSGGSARERQAGVVLGFGGPSRHRLHGALDALRQALQAAVADVVPSPGPGR